MNEKQLSHMPRLSMVLGLGATLLFITACAESRLVGGEENWNYGIFLVLCITGAFGVSLIGIIVSLMALVRVPGTRLAVLLGLVLNLIPGVTWCVHWIWLQIRLH